LRDGNSRPQPAQRCCAAIACVRCAFGGANIPGKVIRRGKVQTKFGRRQCSSAGIEWWARHRSTNVVLSRRGVPPEPVKHIAVELEVGDELG
jgi:hypothetical protein